MKPANLNIRMDPSSGDIWLTEERRNDPRIKRIKNVTQDVLMALCADVTAQDGTKSVSRDIRFSDGMAIRITVEEIDA